MDGKGRTAGGWFPKDDGWKHCTLRRLADDGQRLWLHCYGCHRHRYVETGAWVEKNAFDLDTPILLIARRVRCTRCNRLTVALAAEPYSNLKDQPVCRPFNDATCPVCGAAAVSESGPLRRPIRWLQTSAGFMPHTIMTECECLRCGNWWTQPKSEYRR